MISSGVLSGTIFIDSNFRNLVLREYPGISASILEAVVEVFAKDMKMVVDGDNLSAMNNFIMDVKLSGNPNDPKTRIYRIYITW